MQPWEAFLPDVFEERADDPGVALCPTCLNPTRHNANFCHTCMCPLTWYAGTGPLERVWAWPWILWRTGRTPWPRPIHKWGTTLVLLGNALGLIFMIVYAALSGGEGPWRMPGLAAGWGVLAALIYISMLVVLGVAALLLIVRAWVNWLDRRDIDPWADDA